MKKNLFIVIEGIDGSGKTTLIEGLGNVLSEKKISFVKNFEPTKDNAFGVLIRYLSIGTIRNRISIAFYCRSLF
jgi:thymidylate kinase